ncbi:histidine phosphatase family protein [Leptospira fluminis]|uniref:Histidine phosphatase family protein n=1 Tax=Leptospira fluminis TaxID=2484979 RepID=A0A4R9GS78_9LEPT|nr:histidine phosphatase family protein [Leptospira fluminis]TGK20863.1 histidine phosphatase family protein [Leptospira fluminis]
MERKRGKSEEEMKSTLYLIRHPQTENRRKGVFSDGGNFGLSQAGTKEAEEIDRNLSEKVDPENVSLFASSSLICTESLKRMKFLSSLEYRTLDSLEELRFGIWQNRSFTEFYKSNPSDAERFSVLDPSLEFEGGERISSFLDRAERLKEFAKTELENKKNVILLSHGGLLAILICLFLDLPPKEYIRFRLFSGSVSVLEMDKSGRACLVGLNFYGTVSEGRWPA